MRSREFFLVLAVSLAVASPAFADETHVVVEKSVERSGPESTDMMKLAAAVNEGGEPVVLAPDETLTIKTKKTSYLRPSFSGVYTDCFPSLCPMEESEDAEIPAVNWAGVQSCCEGISCFYVDGNGRQAITDHFFRCVSVNTPQSKLVQSSSEIESAKKKRDAAPSRKPASKKKG